MSANEWFFLGWGLLALGLGLRGIVAPEKAIKYRNRWADRSIRWLTFGRVKKSFGPLMSEEMGSCPVKWWSFRSAILAPHAI
jgi:hypothetical protein